MEAPGQQGNDPTAEAARWLLTLEEHPHDRELRGRFDAWLARGPANAKAWADASDIYRLMRAVPAAHARQWPRLPAKRSGARLMRRLAIGAAAAALFGALFLFGPSVLRQLQADYVTATGEIRALRLDDGSIVHLGADSAVATEFTEDEREVELLRGSAFFEVAPDADRPFRVAAAGVDVTAIGTAFEVRRQDDAVDVAVRDGQVSVGYADALQPISEYLSAGEQARVNLDGGMERGEIAALDVAPWMQGQVIANDRPLADVVDDLRPYYHGMVVLADAELGRKRVTGVYNIADPVAALQAVADAHGAPVERISPWLLIIGAD